MIANLINATRSDKTIESPFFDPAKLFPELASSDTANLDAPYVLPTFKIPADDASLKSKYNGVRTTVRLFHDDVRRLPADQHSIA